MLKEQISSVYIKGLLGPIKNIVTARNPDTFEHVNQLALSEEIELKIDQIGSRGHQKPNKYRTNNNNVQKNNNFKSSCFIC